jgi:phosphatidylserine/phosphatidylglycerophosphate/cardiolipin synthase-like enzyme
MKLMIQPEAGLVPVVQAIKKARRTIDIAIFRLNRTEIETALGAAVQRGVKVRALVAHTNRGGEARLRKLEQRLLAAGVMVSRTADDLVKYHGKYLLIDDSLHLLGFNYTTADTTRSRSFGVQTRDRNAVRDALRLFECDLTRQTYQASPRSPLVVSPDNARETLLQFVRGARRHLAIYDARLQDTTFLNVLRQHIDAGVQVQVIGRAPRLDPGTHVRMLKDLRLHVRAVIRDGTRAFVGSQSLRRLELDRRREVGLIITNPSVTRRMLEIFQRDWESCAPQDKNKTDKAAQDEAGKEESKSKKDERKDEKKDKDEKEKAVEPVGAK